MAWPDLICSPWDVSLGSTALVVRGEDYLAAAPQWGHGQAVQEEELVESAGGFVVPRGNQLTRLRLVRVRDHGSMDEMWDEMAAETAAWPVSAASLTLAGEGGTLTVAVAVAVRWDWVPEDGASSRRTMDFVGGAVSWESAET
jgi:hypothetical protein